MTLNMYVCQSVCVLTHPVRPSVCNYLFVDLPLCTHALCFSVCLPLLSTYLITHKYVCLSLCYLSVGISISLLVFQSIYLLPFDRFKHLGIKKITPLSRATHRDSIPDQTQRFHSRSNIKKCYNVAFLRSETFELALMKLTLSLHTNISKNAPVSSLFQQTILSN